MTTTTGNQNIVLTQVLLISCVDSQLLPGFAIELWSSSVVQHEVAFVSTQFVIIISYCSLAKIVTSVYIRQDLIRILLTSI